MKGSDPPAAPSEPGRGWSGWGLFAVLQAVLCLYIFGEALWGRTLLAPLDLAPTCFTHYRFVDPNSSGVPASNAEFDQVFYDLPLQYGIYQAYRHGEIPWWDPYGFSGRPLLADAHINGTDPVRLLAYSFLPFELAYNWTLVGHSLLSGWAMFLLLRFWGFSNWISVLLGLTFQFAGCHIFFFGYPWVQGAFLYYPLLWICWDAAFLTGRCLYLGLAAIAVAAVFYSGNLQSHSYLVIFGACFGVGYAGLSAVDWRRVFPVLLVSGIIGSLLAAPVLLNQVEFFTQGVRAVKSAGSVRGLLIGLATLTSIYPWMLGDFRTLDVRSAFFKNVGVAQNYGIGFHTFIGSAALILAIAGCFVRLADAHRARLRRTALCLSGAFLLITSSPLITLFYTRSAGLFVLGAIVLAALGLEALAQSQEKMAAAGWLVLTGAVGLALATNLGALVFYPRVLPKVRHALQEHEAAAAPGAIFKMSPAYRAFQIENLPQEVSFKNPETLLAFLSLLGIGALFLRAGLRSRPVVWPALLALNLAPAVLYAHRFVPHPPVVLWERLLAGGPKQQEAIALLRPQQLRLLETAGVRNDRIFPDAMEHLYRVHTVHGYSALIPPTIASLGPDEHARLSWPIADYTVRNGEFERSPASRIARFHWQQSLPRTLEIQPSASLNKLQVKIGDGPAGTLIWTDTYYPGWRASTDGRSLPLERSGACFSTLNVPAGARAIMLSYRPRFLSIGLVCAAIGALSCLGLLAKL